MEENPAFDTERQYDVMALRSYYYYYFIIIFWRTSIYLMNLEGNTYYRWNLFIARETSPLGSGWVSGRQSYEETLFIFTPANRLTETANRF